MIEKSYDEVFSFKNIYKAHLRGRLAKRDKKPLVKFENYMLENLQDITTRLQNRPTRSRAIQVLWYMSQR